MKSSLGTLFHRICSAVWLLLAAGLFWVSAGSVAAQSNRASRTLTAQPGTPQRYQINLQVAPSSTVSVYAVEERIPSGWAVAEVLDLGSSAGGVIRWGPFFDSQPRTLRYSIQATAGASAGTVSGNSPQIP